MWFKNKIGLRIGFSFGLMIVLMILISVAAMSFLSSSIVTIKNIHRHPFNVSNAAHRIRSNILFSSISVDEFFLQPESQNIPGLVSGLSSYAAKMEKDYAIISERFLGDAKDAQRANETFYQWKDFLQKISLCFEQNKLEDARILWQRQGKAHTGVMIDELLPIMDFAEFKAGNYLDIAQVQLRRVVIIIRSLFVFAVIVCFAVSYLTTKSISVPLGRLSHALRHIGRGDLSFRIGSDRDDEIGRLCDAFDKMCDDLQKTMVSVEKLDAANQQLAASEQQLRAANQQFAASEQQLMAANQQLLAANQQLAAGEQQLRAANTSLIKEVEERKRAEKVIEKRIYALTQPLEDDAAVGFTDLFNIADIQNLQDTFAQAMGVSSVITDITGKTITKPSNFSDYCRTIRCNPLGQANCRKSDALMGEKCVDGPVVECCSSGGLWMASAVITVGGKRIANWSIGQVRNEAQNEVDVIEYARQIGVDEDVLVKQFRRLPVVSLEKFNKAAHALHTLANQLSSIAYQNVQQARFISNQKLIQEQLRIASRQAETANMAKSQFLANMSHEIRTPMNAIICLSEMLAEDEQREEQKESLNIIVECGHNLVKLINDILDFSKIEAGELEVEICDCSPDKLLGSVEAIFKKTAEDKGLEFVIEKEKDVPDSICTDYERLHQCLVNLVANAIKFTERGVVRLRVSVDNADGERCVRFDVEDTGIGVAAEDHEMIFEAFKQADGSMTRKYGGTGLGLAITKQLTELLGGKITLQSTPGKGTVFTMMLPAGRCNCMNSYGGGKTNHKTNPCESDKYEGKVLIVEDCATNRLVIQRLMEKLGLEVSIVENGAQAVKEAMSRDYDIIFMDMQMPEMNGYEASSELKRRGLETPIIALTANAMKGDDEKCYKAGCDGYISKPIRQKDVKAIIHKYLMMK